MKKIILHINLVPDLIKYLKSLEKVNLKFDDSCISNLIRQHINKRVAGIKVHSFAQAYLYLGDGFQEWFNNQSRRNLRKNLRKADLGGLKLEIVEFNEIHNKVEDLELDRGGNLRGFWGNFPKNVPKNELICAAVYSNDGLLQAVCIGSDTRDTAKIFAAISRSRSDGARWLAQFGILKYYFEHNTFSILVSDRIGLNLGNLEFQHYFGMTSVNLKIHK